MKKYVLAVDQGTTSSRAILFDKDGLAVCMAQREVVCKFPRSGWVEVDALSIWVSVVDCINEALVRANVKITDIDSIGITNQRETTVIWDKETGMPVCDAIVWQSRQSAEICDSMNSYKDLIHKKTGLLINPYFSASKLRFLLDHLPNGQKRAEKGELLFGTIDTWLIYKFTSGKVHATDVTNASRTMLYNIFENKWDDELCSLFNIPKIMLPKVYPCSHDYGVVSIIPGNIHITGVAGDQQSALFGQTCFDRGESKNTYGTGCFMLMNIGEEPKLSRNGLLTTIAWKLGDKVTYALEGSVFIGGAAVQWLRDQLKMIDDAKDSEVKAFSCSSSHGLYVVPSFVGLGTPYWDDDARGAVFGITRNTNKNHFVRATLEGIAYQCKDVFEIMCKECASSLKSLKVDGGATENKYLMQFQSDILQTPIMLPKCLQTTALGVAYFAGLQTGFFKSLNDIKKIHCYQAIYEPQMAKTEVKKLYSKWKIAVKATRSFK